MVRMAERLFICPSVINRSHQLEFVTQDKTPDQIHFGGSQSGRAKFVGAKIGGAESVGVKFGVAESVGSEFGGAEFGRVEFIGANFVGNGFVESQFGGAKFVESQFVGAKFVECQFGGLRLGFLFVAFCLTFCGRARGAGLDCRAVETARCDADYVRTGRKGDRRRWRLSRLAAGHVSMAAVRACDDEG
ncbi:unnamed protein product [Calypogeia fissa]